MSSVQRATKLLKLKPYKIPVVHALHQPDPNKRLRFCNWVLEKVNSWELDAKEFFLATRHGFIYMDRCLQNYWYYSDWKTVRVSASSGSLMPREAAGRPGKAASDSRLLPRLIYEWLCICIYGTLVSVCAMKGIPIEPLAQWGKEMAYYLTPLLA